MSFEQYEHYEAGVKIIDRLFILVWAILYYHISISNTVVTDIEVVVCAWEKSQKLYSTLK